ncbi:hypothetical protein MNBD_GAMMA09-2040, partial [hydrothermal vent metagenome]
GESFADVQGCTNIAITGRKGAKTCRDALISQLQDAKERRRAGVKEVML